MISKILLLFCFSLIGTGCSNEVIDKTYKAEVFNVEENKILGEIHMPTWQLSSSYEGIEDMYEDADYVVAGRVKNIEYFQFGNDILRKINVAVSDNYKGDIDKNTEISIIENDGYLRLKSLYENLKKEYEDKKGTLDTPEKDQFLESIIALYSNQQADIKDAENDRLMKYSYLYKENSNLNDEVLLFLTNSSEDILTNKKVYFIGRQFSYPEGAYVSLGNGMGKFTLEDNEYKRYNYYYTPQGNVDGMEIIKESYSVKEMKDTLKKLK